jgi:hypothetical protein
MICRACFSETQVYLHRLTCRIKAADEIVWDSVAILQEESRKHTLKT